MLDLSGLGNASLVNTIDMATDTAANTVTQGDHTYAVYNASSAAAAQLLIDQHMVLANHG